MVTAAGCERLRGTWETRRDFADALFRVGFESESSIVPLELRPLAGGHYSTMKPVSSISFTLAISLILLSYGMNAQNTAHDPRKLFEAGEAALHAGKLDEAEREFKQVVTINPGVAGAYANLGVIYMRRKQWPQALEMLRKAEKLAPDIPGIRLNIGLAYFRQNNFARAIQPFESVVQQAPDSFQARYLLGLCYFLNDRWQDAVNAMEPLWPQASDQLNYLYVLDIAAYKAKNQALEEKAATRLVAIGAGSAEFHLLMGKAHLNRGEYDDAIKELDAAAKADSKLPFVHFNLGLAYVHKQDYDRARGEFRSDIAIEPDVPFNFEQLGNLESTVGNDDEAANNYRSALKLDPQLLNAHMGLAKIEEHRRHYAGALSELDQIIRLETGNASAHYLRGQVLTRMGHEKEGREELTSATRLLNEQRAARHKELEGETIPSPELAQEP
jgi:tetratricopeptide (TPR) repeat protein